MYIRLKTLLKNNFWLFALIAFSLLVFAVSVKINWFRYHNFDFGKFDLGNMVQMVWNTAYNGKLLWLTDYFGTNLPRWAMSHVDPILLIFVPLFVLFPHALTLVFSQLALVISCALIIFKLAELELESKFAAFMLGVSFLLYPAVGFLLAWTGFHGVTAILPFFLGAFYVFEKMYKTNNFSKKGLVLFWILLVLSMMGKEQIPLTVMLFGGFVWLFRGKKKLGISMMIVSALWFITAFFIIIPSNAHYRVEGYQKFAQELSIGTNSSITNVALPNYFLSRYADFGDSYAEVVVNMVLQPSKVVRVIFGGDNLKNLGQTFFPMALFPLLYPPLLLLSLPDLLINFLTTEGGIGTGEITNHRVSMVIPGLFISTIYAIGYFSRELELHLKRKRSYFVIGGATLILLTNIYTTFVYNNPIYLWLTQAVEKRLPRVFAKTIDSEINLDTLQIGDVVRLTPLENKDRECALKVVEYIPDNASVTGPDYLGAHLAQRETYGIFPSLYTSADYVIVDIFSQKVLRILDINTSLVNDVVGEIVKNPNYKLSMACGNMFVFENVGEHTKTQLLPMQEVYNFEEKMDYEIFQSLTLVDYSIPVALERGVNADAYFAYVKRGDETLSDYFLFMSFVNVDTGDVYQVANLPSFGLLPLKDWTEDLYYTETIDLVLPEHIQAGTYKAFMGMYNQVRTRSVYLGDVEVK